MDFQVLPGKAWLFEARIRIGDGGSGDKRKGIWYRFYTMGAEYRQNEGKWLRMGEVDVLEVFNGYETFTPTIQCGDVKGGACNESSGFKSQNPVPFYGETSHVVGLEVDRRMCEPLSTGPTKSIGECWDREKMTWFLDGKEVYSIT